MNKIDGSNFNFISAKSNQTLYMPQASVFKGSKSNIRERSRNG
jgi:hypothetical protein